ncbi:hypothetical protein Bhyg_11922 [Pseudolycoriella hygida]|uniref:Uncharacterized protein n=1 Tax=Pseudolycoriella hygida TaxID=35572 RepID=A0A9Q0RZZ5_9DIPT|nr:hypothetical protein Bhyg_11922 [Pseudolycoriella hygida]
MQQDTRNSSFEVCSISMRSLTVSLLTMEQTTFGEHKVRSSPQASIAFTRNEFNPSLDECAFEVLCIVGSKFRLLVSSSSANSKNANAVQINEFTDSDAVLRRKELKNNFEISEQNRSSRPNCKIVKVAIRTTADCSASLPLDDLLAANSKFVDIFFKSYSCVVTGTMTGISSQATRLEILS